MSIPFTGKIPGIISNTTGSHVANIKKTIYQKEGIFKIGTGSSGKCLERFELDSPEKKNSLSRINMSYER
jgi:hypothetical protein